jgi:thioredoxin 1
MKHIGFLKHTLAILALTFSASSFAGGTSAFDKTAFESAKAQGKTVVVDFHADWCSTCKKQKPVLESLIKEPSMNSVVVFTADFDKETDLKKSLNIQKQSTLVVFKGQAEKARQMGLTSREEIKALIEKGI